MLSGTELSVGLSGGVLRRARSGWIGPAGPSFSSMVFGVLGFFGFPQDVHVRAQHLAVEFDHLGNPTSYVSNVQRL